jgi:beta-glucanase (GH16 family)
VSGDRIVVVGDVINDIVVVPRGEVRPDTDTPSTIRPRPGGSAANTAVWLGSLGAPGDIKPEVDAVEYYGNDNKGYYANLHLWQNGKDLYNRSARIAIPAGASSSDYHLYGVSVAPDVITIYFDRQPVAQLPSRPEFMQRMLLLTNLAAGGGWPIDEMPDPSVMQIDYIRAYQPKNSG